MYFICSGSPSGKSTLCEGLFHVKHHPLDVPFCSAFSMCACWNAFTSSPSVVLNVSFFTAEKRTGLLK